ncbi:hypothetical protein [Enterovibrio coralii]|uniref:Uncharacterized protein n=1 Tax=Enterovibrio coralii TaxID=294935 RepID=A0A135I5F0_9GAMM|nr:hypothetical protein [Enterovibrio coralii]KXF80686.1 hypothetical protein ATN88_08610 [Enterovibrio coralii]
MKKALLLAIFLISSPQSFAMTDCVTAKTIDWIRVGETEKAEFNNLKSTIVVKFQGIAKEQLLDIGLNLDNPQGPALLGLLNSAMAIGNSVTVRDSNDTCTQFDQIVVHRANYN